MNKKLLFTLLLTGTTSVGHATDEARLLRFPDERETLQTGQGQMERQNTETAGY